MIWVGDGTWVPEAGATGSVFTVILIMFEEAGFAAHGALEVITHLMESPFDGT